jgi:hypothetical protein
VLAGIGWLGRRRAEVAAAQRGPDPVDVED